VGIKAYEAVVTEGLDPKGYQDEVLLGRNQEVWILYPWVMHPYTETLYPEHAKTGTTGYLGYLGFSKCF